MARPRGCGSVCDREARPGDRCASTQTARASGNAEARGLGARRTAAASGAGARVWPKGRCVRVASDRVPRARWLGKWFRDSSQAFDANRRVQRAARCDRWSAHFDVRRLYCIAARWPCTAWLRVAAASHLRLEARRARRGRIDGCVCLAQAVRAWRSEASTRVVRGHWESLRAARGQRVLSGTEWTLCLPRPASSDRARLRVCGGVRSMRVMNARGSCVR